MKIMKLFYVELLENIDVDHLSTNNMSLLQMITSINTLNVGIDDERRELDNYIIQENSTVNKDTFYFWMNECIKFKRIRYLSRKWMS